VQCEAAGGSSAGTATLSTTPFSVLGTVGYMAPEQVRGQDVDHRADLFALGTILYEMIAGKRTFQTESAIGTLRAILSEGASLPTS